jgi:hypothetical protein
MGEGAFVLGIKVLNQDEAETSISGQVLKQLRESFEATCGSADANDGEARTDF